jgi:hypothetical protein
MVTNELYLHVQTQSLSLMCLFLYFGDLCIHTYIYIYIYIYILCGLSPWANYADRATAACWFQLFAVRVCHVVSVTDPYGHILVFLDRSHYFFFRVATQLYSRGWVDPVPDSLLLRKSGITGNWTQTSGSIWYIILHPLCGLQHCSWTGQQRVHHFQQIFLAPMKYVGML